MIWTFMRNEGQDQPDDARGDTPMGFLGRETDRLFEQSSDAGKDVALDGSGDWVPPLDVTGTATELTVMVEIPGVDPTDLEITIQDRILTLTGQKKAQEEFKQAKVDRSERHFGFFTRCIQLPTAVDTERVSAEHKNGVVLIHLKKLNCAVPRRIPVEGDDD